jgi:4-carboxymuconolactone decarboxylase
MASDDAVAPDADVTYGTRDERLAAARAKYHEVMTVPGPQPVKPYYDAGVVGFVFSEMWPRPLMNRRDRRWITLACVGAMGAVVPIQTHVYATLNSGDCTLEEIEEFNLFFATQCGWPRAQVVDQYVTEAAERCGVQRTGLHRWAEPGDPDVRRARGRDAYREIMHAEPPGGDTVFRRLGYLDYLYGEIWTRPVLTRRDRRIIALCCTAVLQTEAEAHASAALKSGDLSYTELQELVLHYAVYCGWPSGAILDDIVTAAARQAGITTTEILYILSKRRILARRPARRVSPCGSHTQEARCRRQATEQIC